MSQTHYHGTPFPLAVLREGIVPGGQQEGRLAGKSYDNSDDDHVYLAPPDERDLAQACGTVVEVELTDEQVSELEPDPDSTGHMYPGEIPPEQVTLGGEEFVAFTNISGAPLMPADVQGIARDCDSLDELMDEMDDRIEYR